MINNIKKTINSLVGKPVMIKVDVGRNKIEKYQGVILRAYDHIWTFKTKTDVKSFSYTDVLINAVIISS